MARNRNAIESCSFRSWTCFHFRLSDKVSEGPQICSSPMDIQFQQSIAGTTHRQPAKSGIVDPRRFQRPVKNASSTLNCNPAWNPMVVGGARFLDQALGKFDTTKPDGICNSKHHLKQIANDRDHSGQISKKIVRNLMGRSLRRKSENPAPASKIARSGHERPRS